MLVGLDLLGLGNKSWNVNETLNSFPAGTAIGCFDNTFGDVMPHLITLINSGKVAAVRGHIWWDYGHKIVPLDFLNKKLPRWEGLAKQFPNVKVYVSHSCEYSESSVTNVQKRVDLVKQLCPSCIPVQAPMGSPAIPGVMTEEHGKNATAGLGQIASTDGQSLFDIDAEAWINKNKFADIVFGWGARFNLSTAGNATPPPDRKNPPSANYIISVLRLFEPKGPPPAFFAPSLVLTKPSLYKTHSEDNGVDSRANKPCLIIPERANHVDILTHDKQLVGSFPLYGSFLGGMWRYYSGTPNGLKMYGFQIADKAKALSGSPWVVFKANNKLYGPVHPVFRTGFFQG
jgi:hypothetical protein